MKNIKATGMLPIVALAISFLLNVACTEDFSKLNSDPSLLSEDQLDVGLLLTRVQKRMIIDYGAYPFEIYGHYAGYSSSGGNVPFTGGFFEDEFQGSFSNLLNVSEILRLTQGDPEQANKYSIARIMRVYIYQRLTDLYGDIPYSEAARPVGEVITQPVYDTQESIYRDLLNELRLAVEDLNAGLDNNFGSEDLIYGGDVDKWVRLANSLRLRLALRVRYVDQGLAVSHISEVINAELIESNDDNGYVTTSDDFESNQNPIYNEIVRRQGDLTVLMGKTIIDILKDADDPRLGIVATPTPNSVVEAENNNDPSLLLYRGRPLGLDGSEEREHYPDSDLSEVGTFFRNPVIDMPVLYYSEVCFALAEAKLMLDLGSEAADIWYKRGIRADMERYGVDGGDIDDFLDSPVATLTGSVEEQLEQIMSQKNVALFPNSVEAWSEWRRTGYPRILLGSMIGETNGQIPRRISYPVTEINLNSSNYQDASDRMGGDILTARVWWDANTNAPYQHPGDILD
ncbi:SusD/RagB family nutrient-binding outer membrane lipoprotein [Flagellimonas sp.]|uniref:SusD/RagB family nutrient-binding outer membrane lipoprotein n=1 Tax=Flagellimonas sp. TaxID=2058762 RepID=UPI003BAF3BDF